MGVGYAPCHAPDVVPAIASDSGPCRDFDAPLEMVRTSIEAEYAQRVVVAEDRPRLDYLFDVDNSASVTSKITGRDRLSKLNEALDSFGLTRSKNQRWYTRSSRRRQLTRVAQVSPANVASDHSQAFSRRFRREH